MIRRRHHDFSSEVQPIVEALSQIRDAFGHGTAAEIDHRLGRSEGYLGRVLRQEVGLSAGMLMRILKTLEVDPGTFFQQVFPEPADPDRALGMLQRRLESRAQPIEDQETEPHRRLSDWLDGADTVIDDTPLTTPDSRRFDLFERLVFDDPTAALGGLATWLRRCVDGALPYTAENRHAFSRALEIEARAHLAQDHLHTACRRLRLAWRLCGYESASQTADQTSSETSSSEIPSVDTADTADSLRASVLASAAAVVLRSGDHKLALRLASDAMVPAVKARDLAMIGRILRLQGQVHVQAGDEDRGETSFYAALSYLPVAQWPDRFLSLLGLGRLSLRQGRLQAAREFAERADATHRRRRGLPWWHLVELRADLAAQDADWLAAAQQYRSLRQAYLELEQQRPVVSVYLREARAWLEAGETREVLTTAASGMTLLRPLRHDRPLQKVISELAQRALAGELTVDWLVKAEAKFGGGRV